MALTDKLTAIANAIRAKTGKTATMTLDEMPTEIAGIKTKSTYTWNQCPVAVKEYLDNVTYNPNDYSNSSIETYADGTAVTNPIGKTVDGITYYNEIPNVATPFSSASEAGTLKPLDRLRWIKSPARNVRDIGGWNCDGGTVKYGKLFRGGEVGANESQFINTLHDAVGIRAELELQGNDVLEDYSVIGTDVDFCCPRADSYWAYYSIANTAPMREAFRFIFDCVKRGRPLYFHCSAGADRTGTISCLIEAMLGVSQSDCDKDYELTSFNGSSYLRKRCGREYAQGQWEYGYKNLITAINSLTVGSTFRDKVINYIASLGFTADEINAFRASMIDGNPETVTPIIASYSVTKSPTNAAIIGDGSVNQYQSYEASIIPNNGYVITDVSVTMGGIDITNSVFSGNTTNLLHSITNTMSHCVTNNAQKTIVSGQSYGATLTASSGYTLEGATISITMGGVDVSTYYSNGKIAIPKVTGNIVITATAIPTAPSYTNLFDVSGIHEGQRISSGAALEANASQNVSNDIPLAERGATIRIKGAGVNTATKTYRVCYYNGSNWTKAGYIENALNYSYDASTDIVTFTADSSYSYSALRFAYPNSTVSGNIIVTINEAIE